MWDLLIFNPMVNSLLFIYDFLFHNFALAIVVFTILIRLITLPLTLQQQRSTQHMQELQGSKRWQDMQKKYKGDKQKLQEEQLKLYREVGFNPLSGCLPLLIQFPILIGLYQSISRALAIAPPQLLDLAKRVYPFISSTLVPVNSHFLWWDLGHPERLVSPQVFGFGLPVLTILVVVTSWVQTKLTTPPSADAQSRQMSTMMSLYLPLLIGYFSYSYASGLALYFLVSNILTVVQYAAMGKVNWRGLISFRGSA
ncbi:MAG TPA: YidC/Oxa1 family membrane protein insertase [Anaerolineales bacterium]|nr:YidC/Oxa1 family membrane protein insertase [Anaerolineales bacterium]